MVNTRRRSIAATFNPDPRCELLLALKHSDSEAWNRLSALQHMEVGYYSAAKAAAEAEAAA